MMFRNMTCNSDNVHTEGIENNNEWWESLLRCQRGFNQKPQSVVRAATLQKKPSTNTKSGKQTSSRYSSTSHKMPGLRAFRYDIGTFGCCCNTPLPTPSSSVTSSVVVVVVVFAVPFWHFALHWNPKVLVSTPASSTNIPIVITCNNIGDFCKFNQFPFEYVKVGASETPQFQIPQEDN